MNKNTINRPNVPAPNVQRAPPSPAPAGPARSDARPDPARPDPARAGGTAAPEGARAEAPAEGPSNGAVDSGPSNDPGASQPSTGRPLPTGKKKDAKKAQAKEKAQPQRASRHRPSAHAAGAHAAHHEEEGGGGGGAGGAGAIDGEVGDSHRHRHVEHGHVEHLEEEEQVHAEGEEQETAATGADAIKRSKGGDTGGGDGFDQGQNGREAYERYLKGNVDADKERHDELRKKGAKDDFRIDRPPAEVEALGTPRATAHVVRLYDAWTLAGVAREEAVEKAASFLAGFASSTNIRKVLAELETKPIRDVYPLEVLMRMLDERPELLPGVRRGNVLGSIEEKSVLAGHAAVITVPTDVRIKSFALLGGARPGYEFQPHKDEGKYTLLVDTPGEHAFAVLAAPLQQLGRIQRETSEAILEVFRLAVWAMDKKGEPLSPEEWHARQLAEADEDDEDDEDDAVDAEDIEAPAADDRYVELAANLPTQIRKALESITRDEVSGPGATTYTWDASFYRPGGPVGVDAILHLVVNNAGPFDPAWVKAREALAIKQKEFEPGRAVVTQEDFTAALRRARVR